MNAFDSFAPAVLRIYDRDREAFWQATLAPFLSDASLPAILRKARVGFDLLRALRGVDDAVRDELRTFSLTLGSDVTTWRSLRSKSEYFKDFYPIYAFLVIWMKEAGLDEPLERFGDLMRAIAYGIAGYGILDVNLDGKVSSATELLMAQALVAEYETRLLRVFGVTENNLQILHRIRSQFLAAEIKEKTLRGKESPYPREEPIACGYKAAHLLTPFMLSLDRLGKAQAIEAYFEVFFRFGAVIQILDDWKDLEEDLEVGHYALVTHGFERDLPPRRPRDLAQRIKQDERHVRAVYQVCKRLIERSQELLVQLDDSILGRIVTVTDRRLESFFHKELGMRETARPLR